MRPRRTPALVLAIALALTAAATLVVATTGRARDRARFQNAANATSAAIESRLRAHIAILRGTAGLFAASGVVGDDEFRIFVDQFSLRDRYPGVQGIGWAPRIVPDAVDSLFAARRAAGDPAFALRPESVDGERFPIVLLEPRDRRNDVAIGFDMYAQPVRRAAMDAARDAAAPTMSGPVRLVQEIDADRQAGFLIYLPVYAGPTPTEVAERRARLRGHVYAPFRAGDFFDDLFADTVVTPVAFRVFDGLAPSPAGLLYDSQARREPERSAFAVADTLAVYGREWLVQYASLPVVEEREGRLVAPAVAIAGVAVSLLLFSLTRAEARARAAAERSERARGRFFAAMSHELRTPLNAIMGYNDLLLAGVYGELAPTQVVGIERGQRAARHLRELVNDVLDLSKLEAGKTELEEAPVNVPDLVQEIFHTMEGIAAERGTPLRLECVGSVTVTSDPRRVRQIVLNLLSNAVKHGAGSPVLVRCEPHGAGGAALHVTDHGPGIPPEDQERVFEEFVQLPGAAGGGTGLGLPISRRLARLLGGELTLRSEPGGGSTFTLTLPARLPGDADG